MTRTLPLIASFLGLVAAQSPGTSPEVHPKLTTWKCTKAAGCVAQNTAVVLDSLSHPVHQLNNPSLGCGDWGNGPNRTVCPDAETCQKNCIMEGISDYASYGVKTKGGVLEMAQLRPDGSVTSPRLYLLAEGEKKYEWFQLTGKELTFDVDLSKLPCGMNGALYLSEMKQDGGGNAAYGTGYCDAQCFVTPFLDGKPNIDARGGCCNEMDILEANAAAQQVCELPTDAMAIADIYDRRRRTSATRPAYTLVRGTSASSTVCATKTAVVSTLT